MWNSYDKDKILDFLKHYHQTKIILNEITSESEFDELLSEY